MTFLARGRLRQLAHRDHVGAALDELFDFQADLAQIDVEVLQHVGRHAAAFLDQPQQHVLGADVFVVEALGLLIGQLHDLAGAIGKSFVHGCSYRGGCRISSGLEGGESFRRLDFMVGKRTSLLQVISTSF